VGTEEIAGYVVLVHQTGCVADPSNALHCWQAATHQLTLITFLFILLPFPLQISCHCLQAIIHFQDPQVLAIGMELSGIVMTSIMIARHGSVVVHQRCCRSQ
jgi:hypothetical protein